MCVYICIYTYLPTYLPTYLHACMHACMHAYIYALYTLCINMNTINVTIMNYINHIKVQPHRPRHAPLLAWHHGPDDTLRGAAQRPPPEGTILCYAII